MRALILTWEFPPYIAGGLGMACYGLSKALLELGVEIDLMLPCSENVYFPFRSPGDVDTMPVDFLRPEFRKETLIKEIILKSSDINGKLKLLGISEYPESYITPGFSFESFLNVFLSSNVDNFSQEIQLLNNYLNGDGHLFKKVKEFTSKALQYASCHSCDVIHANDWLTYPAGMMLKKLMKKPLVAHIHATEFDRAGGPGDERIHKIEYAGLMAADSVIAVSQYTAQMIMDRYMIDPRKIHVVHNAYTLSAPVGPDKPKLFKDPLVLFLGRVTLQKGPDYLLEVARRVLERYPRVRFVMAGSGDMFSAILKGSATKRLKDRFLFTGFLNREQVESILTATDIFVLPSVSEPFGIAPLEAMAYGAVAIVSKQSGVSEVIKNAYKVDFWDVEKMTDVLVNLLEHPEERLSMAAAGQKEVLSIIWKEPANKTLKVYEEATCSI
ncbi:MAG: glycosyltransferase [Pseudomonadota bacterium]